MSRKELTKTVMMISNWKKPFGLQGFSSLGVKQLTCGAHGFRRARSGAPAGEAGGAGGLVSLFHHLL